MSIRFDFTWPTDTSVYLTLLAVVSIYAITDRLNIEARYGLDPSVFSMLKQLSTVFLIILGFIFLKEQIVLKKIIGSVIIIFANVLLAFNKGKIKFNKYFIMSFVSNFLFAVAMLINVNISNYFNLPLYFVFQLRNSYFLYSSIIKDAQGSFIVNAFIFHLTSLL